MKNLPNDLVTLRLLHQTVDTYLSALCADIAQVKAVIVDNELCIALGEKSQGLEFPTRNIRPTPLEPPAMVAEYGVASDSLLAAMDYHKDRPFNAAELLGGDTLTNIEAIEVLRDWLRYPEGLRDTYSELGNRILDAIDAVSSGREIQHGPPKPPFVLSGVLDKLFNSIWQRADWQKFPPLAPKPKVIDDVWGLDGTNAKLDVNLSRLTDKISEQGGGLSVHSHNVNFIKIDFHQK